ALAVVARTVIVGAVVTGAVVATVVAVLATVPVIAGSVLVGHDREGRGELISSRVRGNRVVARVLAGVGRLSTLDVDRHPVVADVALSGSRSGSVDDRRGDTVLIRRSGEHCGLDILTGDGVDREVDLVALLQALDGQGHALLRVEEVRDAHGVQVQDETNAVLVIRRIVGRVVGRLIRLLRSLRLFRTLGLLGALRLLRTLALLGALRLLRPLALLGALRLLRILRRPLGRVLRGILSRLL